MSYTEVYTVQPSGEVEEHDELRNAHGFAMCFWDVLAKKYVGPSMSDLMFGSGTLFGGDSMKKVWALAKDARLESWERHVLLATFDKFVVPAAYVAQFAKSFRKFGEAHLTPGYSNHAIAMADMLDEWPVGCGVCWNATSVNGDALWYGEEDEEEDDDSVPCHVPYNVNERDDHWLYDPAEVKAGIEPTQLNCGTCNGTKKDPKKRTRDCPDRFCRGGEILVGGMCDCECHDDVGIRHVMPCCTYTYLQRDKFAEAIKRAQGE